MIVTQEEFNESLARIARDTKDPRAGIFGPESAYWRIGRESVLFLAGGRAALLQLAHPYVAYGVDQHSKTKTDPGGRFERTFRYVFRMVFGDRDKALAAARRVYAVHRRITGSIPTAAGAFPAGHRYEANQVDALVWVLATLVDGALVGYERFVGPLTEAERDQYVREAKRFGLLFGIPESALPNDHAEFRRFWDATLASGTITVTEPAREMARFLFSARGMPRRAALQWGELMTAGLLPDRIREEYGFEFGPKRRRAFQASTTLVRSGYALLPDRLRHTPAYQKAMLRISGQPEDPFADWLERTTNRLIVPAKR